MQLKEKLSKFFSPVDLTKGNIIKSIILFTLPILIYLFLQQFYSITDAAICGQNLSANEVAGINDSMCLTYFFIDFGFAAASGFSAIIAEYFGAKDFKKVKESFAVQTLIMLICGIILTVIGLIFLKTFLGFINLDETNSVFQYAYDYLFIILLGIIPVFLYNTFNNALRAVGDSFASLIFLIASVSLNIVLDLLFIITFKWGVKGAAFATVISQCLGTALCFIYAYKKYDFFKIKISDFKTDFKFIVKHLKNGIPLGFEMSILCIGIIIMQGAVVNFDILNNSSSNAAQLGYGCANKTLGLLFTIPNSMGAAVLAFIGQNFGAKDFDRVKKGFKIGIIFTTIGCIILSIFMLLMCIDGAFIKIYLDSSIINEEIIKYGTYYYFVNGPLLFTVGILIIERNGLQGVQKPLVPFLSGIIELIIRVLISLYLPILVDPSNPSSDKAFAFLMLGDGATWLINVIIVSFSAYKNISKLPKNIELK